MKGWYFATSSLRRRFRPLETGAIQTETTVPFSATSANAAAGRMVPLRCRETGNANLVQSFHCLNRTHSFEKVPSISELFVRTPPPAAVLSGGIFCARGRCYVQAMAEAAMAANSVELPPFCPQQGPQRHPFGLAEGCSTFPQAPTRSGPLSDGVGSVRSRPKQSAALANEPTGGSIRSLISAASAEASCTAADGSSNTRNSRPKSRPPKMTMPYLRRECSKVLNDWFSANLDTPYPSTQVKLELQRTSVRSYKIRGPAQRPLVRPLATHN